MVKKLNFKWDEVHDIAEQLEHIKSEKLTNELDKLLSDSPADAADILRQWVSSTNDGP